MRYITFALAKGRLAKHTLSLLEQIGITCEEMKDEKTRKLIFVNEELRLPLLPFQGNRCADLCGDGSGRYRRGRKGYDPGGRT